MGKLPEAKQAGGGIIQQPGFWGGSMCHLLTESAAQLLLGTGAVERPGRGSGEVPASSCSRRALAGDGRGWEEEGERKNLSP